jgi:hypothetical protein
MQLLGKSYTIIQWEMVAYLEFRVYAAVRMLKAVTP